MTKRAPHGAGVFFYGPIFAGILWGLLAGAVMTWGLGPCAEVAAAFGAAAAICRMAFVK
jgi:hypothetical protein